jgi:hypothetical protein
MGDCKGPCDQHHIATMASSPLDVQTTENQYIHYNVTRKLKTIHFSTEKLADKKKEKDEYFLFTTMVY